MHGDFPHLETVLVVKARSYAYPSILMYIPSEFIKLSLKFKSMRADITLKTSLCVFFFF